MNEQGHVRDISKSKVRKS